MKAVDLDATVYELVDASRASSLEEAANFFQKTGDVTVSNILKEASVRASRGNELFDDEEELV